MALVSLFNKTRKYHAVLPSRPHALPPCSRKLEPIESVTTRVFDFYKNPTPGKRSGRDITRRTLRGPALTRWYYPHLRTYGDLWYYQTDEERYRAAKNAFLRSKGRVPPKKGAGKKALKRMADAKKAAAKAAKGK